MIGATFIGETLGATIEGLDLAKPLNGHDFGEIHGVIGR
jgi:hypothetical protein